MYYPGPERYLGQEHGTPIREYPSNYSYSYPLPPSPSPLRGYYGVTTPEVMRNRYIEPPDQGEELLDRLEQTGRVPSKDKFRRMACMVRSYL